MVRVFSPKPSRDFWLILLFSLGLCLMITVGVYIEQIEIYLWEFDMDVDFKTECQATAECGDFTYRFDPSETRGCKLIKGDYSRLFGLLELRGSRRMCQMMKMPKKDGWKFVNEWDAVHGFDSHADWVKNNGVNKP